MKKLRDAAELTIVIACIAVGCALIVLPALVIYLSSLAIEAASRKKQTLCLVCAGFDQEMTLHLTYNPPAGVHTCSKCKSTFTIENTPC